MLLGTCNKSTKITLPCASPSPLLLASWLHIKLLPGKKHSLPLYMRSGMAHSVQRGCAAGHRRCSRRLLGNHSAGYEKAPAHASKSSAAWTGGEGRWQKLANSAGRWASSHLLNGAGVRKRRLLHRGTSGDERRSLNEISGENMAKAARRCSGSADIMKENTAS